MTAVTATTTAPAPKKRGRKDGLERSGSEDAFGSGEWILANISRSYEDRSQKPSTSLAGTTATHAGRTGAGAKRTAKKRFKAPQSGLVTASPSASSFAHFSPNRVYQPPSDVDDTPVTAAAAAPPTPQPFPDVVPIERYPPLHALRKVAKVVVHDSVWPMRAPSAVTYPKRVTCILRYRFP